jgi:tRNA-specific 2-thiouridylase
MFPIGKFIKSDIRKLAEQYNLPTMSRRDSQGICFLGQIKFKEFIKHHLGEIEGDIVDIDSGKILGKHPGYYFFTIGQRSGLKLGGGPWFVVKKDVKKNIIYISKQDVANRDRNEFLVGRFNWIDGEPPEKLNLRVKIRHGETMHDCIIECLPAGQAGVTADLLRVKMSDSDSGIAPGQFAVFYDDEVCLGGGIILEDQN